MIQTTRKRAEQVRNTSVDSKPDPVEHAIIDELDRLIHEWRGAGRPYNSAQWTRDVKTTLCKLGRARGHKVCAKGVAKRYRDFGEWLYDVTWLSYDKDYLIDCPLTLETENEHREQAIWDDWEKLLVSNAEHRVMMFGKPSDLEVDSLLEKMVENTERYALRNPGDRYLLAGFSDQSDSIHYAINVVGIDTWYRQQKTNATVRDR